MRDEVKSLKIVNENITCMISAKWLFEFKVRL